MDIRVLKYFLAVAKEGNITKAAERLHITQPTLSRQLMELESELGAVLFVRGKRNVSLTASGVLFRQRAAEIVSLAEKTVRDMVRSGDMAGGTVSIGCVETAASMLLPDAIGAFGSRYPMVQYEIYSAAGDELRAKIDSGHIDFAVLIEPIEAAKYNSVNLAFWDTWGVLMRRDDPLAGKESVQIEDIVDLPLFLSRRDIVSNEIAGWFGEKAAGLKIFAYFDFMTNIMLLIERGLGYAVTVQGAFSIRPSEALCFIPFSPERKSGHLLAWKKNRAFSQAASLFLEHIKETYHSK